MKQLFSFGTARGGTTFFARMMSLNQQVKMASDPFLPVYRQIRNHSMLDILGSNFDTSQPLSDHYFNDIDLVEKNAITSFDVDSLIASGDLKRLVFELKDRMELASKELVSHLDIIDINNEISYKELFYKLQDILETAYKCSSYGYIAANDNWVVEFLPLLLEIFPEAKFIIMIRDPRGAVASSLGLKKNNPELVPSMYSFARHVRKHMAHTIHFMNTSIYSDRIKVIQYESLSSDPGGILSSVCDFLDIDYDVNMLNTEKFRPITGDKWVKYSNFDVPDKGIYTQSIDGWKTRLTDDVVEFVEYVCSPEMSYFGYKPTIFNHSQLSTRAFDFILQDNKGTIGWRNKYHNLYSEISNDLFRYQLLNLDNKQVDKKIIEKYFIFSTVFEELLTKRKYDIC